MVCLKVVSKQSHTSNGESGFRMYGIATHAQPWIPRWQNMIQENRMYDEGRNDFIK